MEAHQQAMKRLEELRSYYWVCLRDRHPHRTADYLVRMAARRYRLALYVLGFRNAARSVQVSP